MPLIPLIGFGTWLLHGKACENGVRMALETGYKHIDTAHVYENYKAIAKGMKGFDRKALFITSKFFLDTIGSDVERDVEKMCDLALKELKTDYLDLFLIHWPLRQWPIARVFAAMASLVDKQKLKAIGVSNFTIHHMQDLLKEGLKIDANQVEFHPYLYQKELLDFCQKNRTKLIAFRPFGKGELIQATPLFAEIGKKYGKTAAQILLRWTVEKEIPVIPKASSKQHIEENFNVFDFSLSSTETQALDSLNRNYRYCEPDWADFNY